MPERFIRLHSETSGRRLTEHTLKDDKIDNTLPWGRVRGTLVSPVCTLLPRKENNASWMPEVELAEKK